MRILALDSSAKTASCAVVENETVLCESAVTTGLTHSQTLLLMVQSMLSVSQIPLSTIDAVAVSNGPGSFTGLRIGLSAAKGIAQPRGLLCAPVSTLLALACNLSGTDGLAVAVMDARRDQVYHALFDLSGSFPVRLCEDQALSISELTDQLLSGYLNRRLYLVGDGAELCYTAMKKRLAVTLSPPQNRLLRASGVGFCGLFAARAGELIPAGALVPNYIRLSSAERLLREKQ